MTESASRDEQVKFFIELVGSHANKISKASYDYLTHNKHNKDVEETWSVVYEINQTAHDLKQTIDKYKSVL